MSITFITGITPNNWNPVYTIIQEWQQENQIQQKMYQCRVYDRADQQMHIAIIFTVKYIQNIIHLNINRFSEEMHLIGT